MKDSAALLHISLHRESNLYGRLLGDVGKSLKKKNFFKIIYESTDSSRSWVFLVTQNTQPIGVTFGLLRSFAAIFLTSRKIGEKCGIVK